MTFKIETIELHVPSEHGANYCARDAVENMIKTWRGFKRIGSGCYGTVYGSRRSDIVYKVGDAADNDGYLSYVVALSKCTTHNKFTPRIHGVRIYKTDTHDSYFIVAMEKLRKLPASHKKEIYRFGDIYDEIQQPRLTGTLFNAVLKIPKQLRDALELIVECESSVRGISGDFHSGNFMMRGKQVVIIDPLA